MLILYETPAGYALFKVLKEKKLEKIDDIIAAFASSGTASKAYHFPANSLILTMTFFLQRESSSFQEVQRHQGSPCCQR